MGGVAFFDLDGTLIAANSARLYVLQEFRAGRLPAREVAMAFGFLAAYRLGVADIAAAYERALRNLIGVEEAVFRAASERFFAEEVVRFEAAGARACLEAHRAAGDRLVLVTSSTSYVAEAARVHFGLEAALSTAYEVVDGRFTGRTSGTLCYGEGKVTVARAWAEARGLSLDAAAFYSDSRTDLPLLEAVGAPFVVAPDPRLRWSAWKRGWPVLDWGGPTRRP